MIFLKKIVFYKKENNTIKFISQFCVLCVFLFLVRYFHGFPETTQFFFFPLDVSLAALDFFLTFHIIKMRIKYDDVKEFVI